MSLDAFIDPEAIGGLKALRDAFGPKGFNGVAEINARREALKAVVAAGPKADPEKVSIDVRKVPGLLPGDPEVELRIIKPKGMTGDKNPCVYFIHGGGMVLGRADEFDATCQLYALALNAVVANVDYRLAPENPDPALINDCFAGLRWVSANAAELGIDNSRIAITGNSAGGGLAAGTALKARDEKLTPPLKFQCLVYPMLDDRHVSVSSQQIYDIGVWDREANIEAWNWYLGRDASVDPTKQTDVSIYAAPARATDLSGLPPAYIDVGDLDAFRDEDIEYATKLMHTGIPCELHVVPGAYHAWEVFGPEGKSAKQAVQWRIDAMRRGLAI